MRVCTKNFGQSWIVNSDVVRENCNSNYFSICCCETWSCYFFTVISVSEVMLDRSEVRIPKLVVGAYDENSVGNEKRTNGVRKIV